MSAMSATRAVDQTSKIQSLAYVSQMTYKEISIYSFPESCVCQNTLSPTALETFAKLCRSGEAGKEVFTAKDLLLNGKSKSSTALASEDLQLYTFIVEQLKKITLSVDKMSDFFSLLQAILTQLGEPTQISSQLIFDVKNWLPKVRSGGYIWFDDANWESTTKAVQYLLANCDLDSSSDLSDPYLLFRKR
jgi:hypothetical protein